MLNKDLQANLEFIDLYDASWGADAYSKYLDTQGLALVGFLVRARMSTGSAGNTLTPAIMGYTGAAPGTASGYAACAAAELLDAFTAYDDTDTHVEFVALKEARLYRYYCVKLEEDGTAAGDVSVTAVVVKQSQPSEGATPTTGAVS